MKSEAERSSKDLDEAGIARRSFLDNAGKLAAYTPPLMLGLLMPGGHAIASGTVVQPDPTNYPSGDDDDSNNDDDGGD